ncbi:hypothetical protein OKW35_006380 [Paraburkholderia sp. MM5477-R1]
MNEFDDRRFVSLPQLMNWNSIPRETLRRGIERAGFGGKTSSASSRGLARERSCVHIGTISSRW